MQSWLLDNLTHLSLEFSFADVETTLPKREVVSEPPPWHDYFMGMAKLASLRSKDPCTKVFLHCTTYSYH